MDRHFPRAKNWFVKDGTRLISVEICGHLQIGYLIFRSDETETAVFGIIGKQKITDLSKVGTHYLKAFNAKQRKNDLDLKIIETWGFLNCVLRS